MIDFEAKARRLVIAIDAVVCNDEGILERHRRVATALREAFEAGQRDGAEKMRAALGDVVDTRHKGCSKSGDAKGMEACRLIGVFMDEAANAVLRGDE